VMRGASSPVLIGETIPGSLPRGWASFVSCFAHAAVSFGQVSMKDFLVVMEVSWD
jgi:hypothetical protein